MRKPDLPRFAGLRNGDLLRPARPIMPWVIIAMATAVAITTLFISIL